MSRTARPLPRLAAAVAIGLAAVGAFAAVGALAAPAAAHSAIVASTPEDGAVLAELPAEFSVTANEDLLDASGTGEGFVLAIVGADGTHYEDGRIAIDGPTLSTTAVVGEPGGYTLEYRIVSEDGHPVEGAIGFTWAPDGVVPTAGPAPEENAPETANAADPAVWLWIGGAAAVVLLVAGGIAVAVIRRR